MSWVWESTEESQKKAVHELTELRGHWLCPELKGKNPESKWSPLWKNAAPSTKLEAIT